MQSNLVRKVLNKRRHYSTKLVQLPVENLSYCKESRSYFRHDIISTVMKYRSSSNIFSGEGEAPGFASRFYILLILHAVTVLLYTVSVTE